MLSAVSFCGGSNLAFRGESLRVGAGFADPRTPEERRKDMDEQMMYFMCLGAKAMRDAIFPGKKEPDALDKAVEKMGERERNKLNARLLDPRKY